MHSQADIIPKKVRGDIHRSALRTAGKHHKCVLCFFAVYVSTVLTVIVRDVSPRCTYDESVETTRVTVQEDKPKAIAKAVAHAERK